MTRRDIASVLIATVIAVAVLPASAAALAPLELTAQSGRDALGPHLEYIEDADGHWSLEDVTAPVAPAGEWRASDKTTPAFGFTSSVYWVRFALWAADGSGSGRLLELGYPHLDDVRLYVPSAGGGFEETRVGDLLPFGERGFGHQHFVFTLPPLGSEPLTFYLRIETESSLKIPLTVWSHETFTAADHNQQLALGTYYGVVLSMILYNLFLFFSLRDRAYLYYVFSIAAFGFLIMSYNGLAYQYLWPSFPWWNNRTLPFFIGITSAAMTKFAQHFLDTRENVPRIDRLLLAWFWFGLLVALVSLIADYAAAISLAYIPAFINVALFIATGVICYRRGYKPALYYLLAWTMVILGALFNMLCNFAILPSNVFTEHSLQIGSAAEVILLSLGLADRINELKREKNTAQSLATASKRLALFFPARLVERILDPDTDLSLVSNRRNITIFFSDLVGFTKFSDRTEPETVSRKLNEYFTEMVRLMDEYGCTLDKFMGDGIMGFFGAPDEMEPQKQAYNAVAMATAMQRKLAELGEKWLTEGLDHDIKMRVGIHQEYVTVGNFGSDRLMSYTAIGGGVNLASRLEAAAKPGQLLVSFPVWAQTQDHFPFGELANRRFKGVSGSKKVAALDPATVEDDHPPLT